MSNTNNLKAHEGVEKLKDLVDDIRICLFSTNLTLMMALLVAP
jgi:hypothetical protein